MIRLFTLAVLTGFLILTVPVPAACADGVMVSSHHVVAAAIASPEGGTDIALDVTLVNSGGALSGVVITALDGGFVFDAVPPSASLDTLPPSGRAVVRVDGHLPGSVGMLGARSLLLFELSASTATGGRVSDLLVSREGAQ